MSKQINTNNLAIDLSKGMWAFSLQEAAFFFRAFEDIVAGKTVNLNFKAKQMLEIYDNDLEPVRKNSEGLLEVPEGSVAILNLIGPIISYGDYWIYGADEIIAQLEKLNDHPNIKAILVFINGPGGAVSAISPFLDFGKIRNKKKPLGIVYEQCCSAHLYLAYGLQPDFVWASNNITASIGSLGVMVSYIDDQEWLKQMGLKRVALYPDESEDKNKPLRLALEGKFDLIKTEMLSPLAKRFQADMIRLNPKLKHEQTGVLTGKVFYSDDAISNGFTEKVGTMKEAMAHLQILSETNHYK